MVLGSEPSQHAASLGVAAVLPGSKDYGEGIVGRGGAFQAVYWCHVCSGIRQGEVVTGELSWFLVFFPA